MASTITGNLDATAAGKITDSGAVSVAGTTKLAAGANDITLDNPDHLVGTVTVTSGHNVTLNNDTALDLGASTITGNLDATAAGNITDSGAVECGWNDEADGEPRKRHHAGQSRSPGWNGDLVTSGHNVTLNNDTALDLGASTITK